MNFIIHFQKFMMVLGDKQRKIKTPFLAYPHTSENKITINQRSLLWLWNFKYTKCENHNNTSNNEKVCKRQHAVIWINKSLKCKHIRDISSKLLFNGSFQNKPLIWLTENCKERRYLLTWQQIIPISSSNIIYRHRGIVGGTESWYILLLIDSNFFKAVPFCLRDIATHPLFKAITKVPSNSRSSELSIILQKWDNKYFWSIA